MSAAPATPSPGWWGALRLVALSLVTLPLIPVQALAVRLRWPLAATLPVFWHRLALATLGVRVTTFGAPATGRPLLVVANHASWLDILILGGRMPLSFVAKTEVATWPVFGLFAKLQRSVFVDRARRGDAGRTATEMAARMVAGDSIVLFAEGTTSDGNQVLPFRSALLGAARHALGDDGGKGGGAVLVQPVAIAYLRRHGVPLGHAGRALVAWPGDVDLVPHLMTLVRSGPFDVAVAYGPPRLFDAMTDRKQLTAALETDVRRMHNRLNAGRFDGFDVAGH
jgi:1-acyl-sn-glycerol-3-phosphate acyltransferase